jgi:hypothetical protein
MVTKVIRESVVEKHLVSRIASLGGMTRKLKWVGKRGAPDRLVILHGHVYFIELKRPKGTPDPLQVLELARINNHGGTAITLDSVEAIDNWLHLRGYLLRA